MRTSVGASLSKPLQIALHASEAISGVEDSSKGTKACSTPH